MVRRRRDVTPVASGTEVFLLQCEKGVWKPFSDRSQKASDRARTNRVGSFISVAVCRLNGSCLLIAPSDCEPSCESYSDVRRVATELGFDGASGCHAKHFR